MNFSTRTLARASARHPWRVVAAWLGVLAVSFALISTLLSDGLTTEMTFANKPEAVRGADLLEQRLRGPEKTTEAVIVRSDSLGVHDPAFRSFVEDLHDRVSALGPAVVEGAVSYYQTGDQALVSRNGDATVLWVVMAGDKERAHENVDQLLAVTDGSRTGGFEVYVAGNASISHDFQKISERDMQKAEVLDVPVALLILVLVFGAVVAAVVPIALAVFAIIAAIGMTALIGQAFQFSFFVTNMILMMGLAVGIDYSLFIISRFREERVRGFDVVDAISEAGGTASRAVFFSGVTVVLALTGMLIIPTTVFRSLAMGAILVVVFSVLTSLTLLPAVLALLGDQINRLHLPFIQRAQSAVGEERPGGFWDRVARTVMRHPVIALSIAVVVLVLATLPALSLKTGSAGVSTLPDSLQSKQGFLILQDEFAGGRIYTADIVIDGPTGDARVQQAVAKLQATLAEDTDFGQASFEANAAGDLGLLSASMVHDPNSEEAIAAVRRLRSEYIPQAFAGAPARVYVSGATAFNTDFFDLTDRYMPVVFGFVLGLSFVLLTIVFRSLVVPAKALLMNLLSVGSAYGLLVLVSQKGVGADILGFRQVETIEAWLPLFLFSVLFGLSMDYHVFLLSRIRERFDQTNDNTDAVAFGLRSTGKLITGAALIMVAVFSGFAMGDLVMFQQMGFGLGVAVLIDATVVRSLLVPASMKLLGQLNWWLPRHLQWLPRVGIEGRQPAYVRSTSPR